MVLPRFYTICHAYDFVHQAPPLFLCALKRLGAWQCKLQLQFYPKSGYGSVVVVSDLNIIIFMRINQYSWGGWPLPIVFNYLADNYAWQSAECTHFTHSLHSQECAHTAQTSPAVSIGCTVISTNLEQSSCQCSLYVNFKLEYVSIQPYRKVIKIGYLQILNIEPSRPI